MHFFPFVKFLRNYSNRVKMSTFSFLSTLQFKTVEKQMEDLRGKDQFSPVKHNNISTRFFCQYLKFYHQWILKSIIDNNL